MAISLKQSFTESDLFLLKTNALDLLTLLASDIHEALHGRVIDDDAAIICPPNVQPI